LLRAAVKFHRVAFADTSSFVAELETLPSTTATP